MTAWHRGPMLAFDLETTGPQPDSARIVTATIIEVGPTGVARTREWLLNPGVDIPAGATAVHGITTTRAREDGTDPGVAVFEITAELGTWLHKGLPVVGHNVAYDFTVLDRECRRHDVDPLDDRLDVVAPVVDTFTIDKAVDRYRKGKRTLEITAAHYGIRLDGAHDATADALAAARIAYRLAEQYPAELQVPLEDLHGLQVGWRTEQQAGLRAYFDRKGIAHDGCSGAWPVQPVPDGWDPAFHAADDVEAGAA